MNIFTYHNTSANSLSFLNTSFNNTTTTTNNNNNNITTVNINNTTNGIQKQKQKELPHQQDPFGLTRIKSTSDLEYPRIVNRQYVVLQKLGSGSFGVIRLAKDTRSQATVAIKFESLRSRHPQLLYESRLYKILHNIQPSSSTQHLSGEVIGVPKIHWFGVEESYNILVMERLGPSLEDLFNFCSRRFSLKTVLMLADQMFCRLQYLHTRHYIHRDIKPENFVMGTGRRGHHLYLIDYGLAKKFMIDRHNHIKLRKNKSLTGTARYTSINSHNGVEQSRRDDLESIGYLLVYFLKGSLPWQGVTAATREKKYKKISQKKSSTKIEKLCEGLPLEFSSYFHYVKGLRFEERPDYTGIRRKFQNLFNQQGFTLDWVFDWNLLRMEVYAEDTEQSGSSNSDAQDDYMKKVRDQLI